MKIIKHIKENWLSWFLSVFFVFPIIFNQEISVFSKNIFLTYLTQSFPFIIIILTLFLATLYYSIDENLWDDFKKGRDIYIDRIMKKIKVLYILIFTICVIWLLMICYNIYNSFQFNIIKSIVLIITPISILVFTYKEFYSLEKEYNS